MKKKSIAIVLAVFLAAIFGCTSGSMDTTKLAEKSRAILNDQVKNGTQKTRETIVRLTGGMVDSEAVPLLRQAFKDMQPAVVDKAIDKAIEKKYPETRDEIRARLGDKFDTKLLEILIELKATDIDANIEKGLQSLRPNDRAFAVELLGKYKGKLAEDRLKEYANDPNELVRMKAKLALARNGDKDVIKALGNFLDMPEMIEAMAVVSLVNELDLKEYRDKLLKIANEDKGMLGLEAVRTLYKWDDPESKGLVTGKLSGRIDMTLYPLLKMVEEKKDKLMIDPLRHAMASSTPNERYSSARVAVAIDPQNTKDVLEFILKGMDSDDPGVREQVAVSLSQLPGIPEVKRVLEQKGIKDSSPQVVNASLVSLGKVGDEESIKAMAPLLDTGDLETRATAAAAILNLIDKKNLPGKSAGASSDVKNKDQTQEGAK